MNVLFDEINTWMDAGIKTAIATVVKVSGSAPRPLGARMLIAEDGRFAGSVSGGCVESAVIQEAMEALKGDARRLHFGITDEMSWEVGLACGGKIDVLVQPADPEIWQTCQQLVEKKTEFSLLTVINGPPKTLGRQAIIVKSDAPVGFEFPKDVQVCVLDAPLLEFEPGQEILVEPFLSPPVMLIVGGVHAAVPLSQLAHMMGYRVVIADPRRHFANQERFPNVEQILVEWPQKAFEQVRIDGQSAVVILTHDPKIDEPALTAALETEAFYVGAIGSRKTHAKRKVNYAHLGVKKLERIHGPIGLDIGGDTPEEMALSIMAEITAVKYGRRGGFLKGKTQG
ncbi:MAG: XdhC family protein [Anaerolineales bacterium]|nr:XdhC family protein [Anaerolineales bacterium]